MDKDREVSQVFYQLEDSPQRIEVTQPDMISTYNAKEVVMDEYKMGHRRGGVCVLGTHSSSDNCELH